MRHRKSGLQLNRNSSNRKALFRNLAVALIEHNVIKTTLPKAKELRRFVEPLVTLTKEDTVANRRLAYSRLNNKAAVGMLFAGIGKKSANRNGGYTRIIKASYRTGDSAPMAYIEFVDRLEEIEIEEDKIKPAETSTNKTTDNKDSSEKNIEAIQEKVNDNSASSSIDKNSS